LLSVTSSVLTASSPISHSRSPNKSYDSQTLSSAVLVYLKTNKSAKDITASTGVPARTITYNANIITNATTLDQRRELVSWDQVYSILENASKQNAGKKGNRLLTDTEEAALVDWLARCRDAYLPCTDLIVQAKVHQILRLDNRDDAERSLDYWIEKFKARNKVSYRKIERVAAGRETGMLKLPGVAGYFSTLAHLINAHNLKPDRIWAADECGCASWAVDGELALVPEGSKRALSITKDFTQHISVCHSVNGYGQVAPPGIMLEGKNIPIDIGEFEEVQGTIFGTQENGYYVQATFLTHLKHIKNYADRFSEVDPDLNVPIIVIVDGASPHIDLEIIDYCVSKNIHLLFFPSHLSHMMQVSDLCFFYSFKAYLAFLLREHTASQVEQNMVPTVDRKTAVQCVGKAYAHASDAEAMQSGFSRAGIIPFRPTAWIPKTQQGRAKSCKEINSNLTEEARAMSGAVRIGRPASAKEKHVPNPLELVQEYEKARTLLPTLQPCVKPATEISANGKKKPTTVAIQGTSNGYMGTSAQFQALLEAKKKATDEAEARTKKKKEDTATRKVDKKKADEERRVATAAKKEAAKKRKEEAEAKREARKSTKRRRVEAQPEEES